MLLMMLERAEKVHSAVFFDTGWEFPGMLDHVNKLSDYVLDKYGVNVWTIYPRLPFEFQMIHKPIVSRKGENKGEIHRVGNGWPSPFRRWCTRHKIDQIEHYLKNFTDVVSCIGYGSDEYNRVKDTVGKFKKRYPLIEYGITEAEALQYCYGKGFDWGGLYEIFHRVSCFCCPFKKIGELRLTRKHFPDLWSKMLKWDSELPTYYYKFKGNISVIDLENRFAEEDRQMDLFPEFEETI